MKTDLDRAQEALADGRTGEASVYAWNALVSIGPEQAEELVRIARELGDSRLLGEIERRGLAALPTQVAEPVKRRPARRLLRAFPALLFALVVVVVIVAINAAESGARYPAGKDAASEYRFTRPLLSEPSGVWLVPLAEPRSVDISRLVDELAVRYRIPVAVLPDIALPSWTLDAKERSLVGDELIRLLGQAYRARGSAAIIGITDYEMYGSTEDREHVFSWRAPPHYAVVSTSPLGANILDRLRGHSRHVRTRKLIARNIGFLYYRRHPVDDPHSLLRPPMHGVHDIDQLNEAL